DTVYDFSQADVVLALDADFLVGMPGSLRYAREFIDRRRVALHGPKMNRLYVVESAMTLAGASADHRLPLRASDVEHFARGVPDVWLATVVKDLQEHSGASLVIAGEGQPAIVHALVHAINRQLDDVGKT